MVRKLREGLSYANVMATVALFVALGGKPYAALKVGSGQISNNSVRSKDLRNNDVRGKDIRRSTVTGSDVGSNTLTGADVLESSLGRVPAATAALSATNATNATNAQQASNASTVGNVAVARIDFRVADGTAQRQILDLGGLILRADCTPADDLDIEADTKVAGAYMQSAGTSSNGGSGVWNEGAQDSDFNPGDDEDLLVDSDDFTVIHLGYSNPAGSQVTALLHIEDDEPTTNGCLVAGHAFQSG